ncbi:MAG: DUF3857 and transglutaminase domain-containing protein [Candidatus Neomarinimicrobiota bacterium]
MKLTLKNLPLKSLSVLLLITIFFSNGFSAGERKWGKVDSKYLDMTVFPEDTSAAAIKIYDTGLIDVTYSGRVEMTYDRHFQIKILKTSAKSYADIIISYWHKDHINSIDAQTILPNGKKFKVNSKNIFDEEAKNNFKVKKFTLPNVEVGSVLEVRYKLISRDIHELEPWYYHSEIPVIESEIVVQMSPYYKYLVMWSDPDKLITQTKEKYFNGSDSQWYDRFRFKAVNLPAIKDEPFISTLKNYKARVDFQIESFTFPPYHYQFIQDVKSLCNTLVKEEYNKFIGAENDVRDLVLQLTAGSKTNTDKARIIFEYVRDNIADDSYEYGIYVHKDPKQILKDKKASDSEKNMLMMTMLRVAGLETKPILISTRDHGLAVPQIPFLSQYNKTILLVDIDGNTFMFDASDPWITYGQLPPSSLVKNAMLIEKDNVYYMEIPNTGLRSLETIESNLQLSPQGKIEGTSRMMSVGYASSDRNRQLYKNKDAKELILKNVANHLDDFTVTQCDSGLKPVPSDTFKTKYSFILDNHTVTIGDEIYLKPAIFFGENKNVFVSENRAFPVEFEYGYKNIETNSFLVPDNYSVVEMPKGVYIDNEYLRYRRTVLLLSRNPLRIGYTRQFEIKKLTVPPEDYRLIKYEFSRIVDADQEVIILKSN